MAERRRHHTATSVCVGLVGLGAVFAGLTRFGAPKLCLALAVGVLLGTVTHLVAVQRATGQLAPVSEQERVLWGKKQAAVRTVATEVRARLTLPQFASGSVEPVIAAGMTGLTIAQSLWQLGSLLTIAFIYYLLPSLRLARARGHGLAWCLVVLPVPLLMIDAAIGYGTWWAALPALLPIVVVPATIWRDL